MTRLRVMTVLLCLLAGLLGTFGSLAQEAQPSVVYDNLVFPELPYPSRWVEVNGARLHYLEAGDPAGQPIVLLHGIPTWSYIWRDIMPRLEDQGRVIAVDLLGFGRSDRPDLAYDFITHRVYFEGFVEALGLSNMILVIQDLGSVVGFDYAARHESNVSGIVYMEAAVPPFFPPSPEAFEAMGPLAELFQTLLTPGVGEAMLLDQNFFIETFIPSAVLRTLSEDEMNAYRAPFPTPESRLPIWYGPQQFINPDSVALLTDYISWMSQTDVPMLQLYVEPGAISPKASVDWAEAHIKNYSSVLLGPGGHFVQEDYPEPISAAIIDWLTAAR